LDAEPQATQITARAERRNSHVLNTQLAYTERRPRVRNGAFGRRAPGSWVHSRKLPSGTISPWHGLGGRAKLQRTLLPPLKYTT
jgi:hypothetical protein